MDEELKVIKEKCKFCQKRYVIQQEWKKEFEKVHCATCIAFLRYLRGTEKALTEELNRIGVLGKRVDVFVVKDDSESGLLRKFGFIPSLYEEDKEQ